MAKAKGSTLVEVVKFLRRQPDAARRVLPARLHRYLVSRVMAASWYPEEDLLGLLRGMLELVPGDRDETLANAGRLAARLHSEGVYAHLLSEADDPLSLPRRGFALWSSQHDSGRMAVALEGVDRARIELHDYAATSREMCRILTGYTEEMLRLAGLAGCQVRKQSCRLDGAPLCVWLAHWQNVEERSRA